MLFLLALDGDAKPNRPCRCPHERFVLFHALDHRIGQRRRNLRDHSRHGAPSKTGGSASALEARHNHRTRSIRALARLPSVGRVLRRFAPPSRRHSDRSTIRLAFRSLGDVDRSERPEGAHRALIVRLDVRIHPCHRLVRVARPDHPSNRSVAAVRLCSCPSVVERKTSRSGLVGRGTHRNISEKRFAQVLRHAFDSGHGVRTAPLLVRHRRFGEMR